MADTKTVAESIATAIQARDNCEASGNTEWYDRWDDLLEKHEAELPSGAGWDCGTKIDFDKTTDTRLVLHGSYHHMNDGGMYDGWTDHSIIVTPTFSGIDVRITGRDRNAIKDYLADLFHEAMTAETPNRLI